MANIVKYRFSTKKFKRPVIPGSAIGNREPGLCGTIDFEPEPREDKDKGNKLEKWLRKNTASPPRYTDEDGRLYNYHTRGGVCSITLLEKTSRDDSSPTDPLVYHKTALISIQPAGKIPIELSKVLRTYGYNLK